MASLDPSGIGIEMETVKPNWYDALNGLPGLMGSSISETLELKRLIQFLQEKLEAVPASSEFTLYGELHSLILKLNKFLVLSEILM